MTLMKEYIYKTPEALKNVLFAGQQLSEILKNSNFDKIVLTGSGTSFHSGMQMRQWMSQISSLPVEVYYPFQVCDEIFLSKENRLFIGISQDGGSYSTFKAMEIAKQNHCLVASISGYQQVLIDEIADYHFTLPLEPEKAGPKTMGYSATKLQLLLIANYINGKNVLQEEIKHHISKIVVDLSSYIEQIFQWVENQKSVIAKAKEIKLIVPAHYYGDGLEGALKILETLRIPVVCYEYDEFIHGIYNAVDENTFLIFYDDGSVKNILTLFEVLSEWTTHIYVIANYSNPRSDLILPIEKYKEYQTFILSIVYQVLANVLAEEKGINPDLPKDPYFHSRVGSKKII